ncbi:MAG: carbohydrate kinase family protein [Candidatus Hodarchaeales archaeon]
MGKRRVFCLGHISVDVFIHRKDLNELKIGGCIFSPNMSFQGGGVAANVAYWLGALGTDTSMIGVIADDPAGFFLKNDLEKVNVKCYLKISIINPSAGILIIVEEDGERSFIINGKCLDELTISDVPLDEIRGGNLFYTSAYNIEKPPINRTVIEIMKMSKQNPSTFETMFNLAAYTTVESHKQDIKQNILPTTDILVGNHEEYKTLTGELETEYNPLGILSIVKNEFNNIKILLLTDGENGCYFISEDDQGHIPASKIIVSDSTGAGDGFTAGFIYGYTTNLPLRHAIKSGLDLGSHICQGFGARFNPQEYLKKMER